MSFSASKHLETRTFGSLEIDLDSLRLASASTVWCRCFAMRVLFVTNIDDIIVLPLFCARGAGQRGTTAKIAAGQYLGFVAILVASVAVALGAGLILPDSVIAYFGLH